MHLVNIQLKKYTTISYHELDILNWRNIDAEGYLERCVRLNRTTIIGF
jgi:hypothetical protein